VSPEANRSGDGLPSIARRNGEVSGGAGRTLVALVLFFSALRAGLGSTALFLAGKKRRPGAEHGPSFLSSLPYPALLVDEGGTILGANRLAEELPLSVGRERRGLEGENIDEAFLPPYFGSWSHYLKRAAAGEGTLDRPFEQYYLEDRSGVCKVWAHPVDTPLEGVPRGNVFLVIVQDITAEATETGE